MISCAHDVRFFLASGIIGLLAFMELPSALAQTSKITVVDAQCRAQKIAKCVATPESGCWAGGGTDQVQTLTGTQTVCKSSPPNTPWRSREEYCSIKIDAAPGEDCFRSIDFDKLIQTQAETNTILRQDMRLLLNQFCKSYSPKPEACDTTMPATK